MMNVGSNWASYQKGTPLQVVRKKKESQSVVMSSHWKKSQDSLRIPVNRPESGGTVPIFAAMSRCPAKHFTCPEFLRRRKVCPLVRASLRRSRPEKGVARSCACICIVLKCACATRCGCATIRIHCSSSLWRRRTD